MHVVAVVAFDAVVPFDLAVPCEVFGRARLANGKPAYQVKVCGTGVEVDAGPMGIACHHGLSGLRGAQTIVVPGVSDSARPLAPSLLRALRAAHARGVRIVSICSGAFVLAAAGLLSGRRATTHWAAAGELARRYPDIDVDPSVLYVDSGQVLTSAGAAAGLDLCIYLVRLDYGAGVAADVARLSVMPLERAGGQAQFIAQEPPSTGGDSLEPVLGWMRLNLRRELPLQVIARRAAMSARSLSRKFREQTGTTPTRWLLHARVCEAQRLLEATRHPLERIASLAGFGSSATFRLRFHALVGTSPSDYRRNFRSGTGDRLPRPR